MDLGKKILELRKKENLSQEQLAEKMNVTRQTISKWELNETTPDIKQAKELSKLFKEQTQLGYSKILPQLALGQSQSSILANAYFENDILNLVEVFIPPMSSNTMNSAALLGKDKQNELVGVREYGRDHFAQ